MRQVEEAESRLHLQKALMVALATASAEARKARQPRGKSAPTEGAGV